MGKVKVYVAAPFEMRDRVRQLHVHLEGRSMGYTSTWAYVETNAPLKSLAPEVISAAWKENMDAIDACDYVIATCFPGTGREMFVECGVALTKGKQVVFVGNESHFPLSAFGNLNAFRTKNFDAACSVIEVLESLKNDPRKH